MIYGISYHRLVKEEDLPEISADMLFRIKEAVKMRLGSTPERYGRPMRKNLKGFWKLTVGSYRVVYRILRGEARVLSVAHRNNAYRTAAKKMRKF